MKRMNFRVGFLLGFLASAVILGYALYAQFHLGLEPCPLCIFQRLAFGALGIVFLLGGLHAPKSMWARRVYVGVGSIAALVGLGVAGRHVWLTHLPEDQVPACGPPLSFMMESNPLTDVIKQVLTGSGQCAKIDWTFLGLSMPAWSLASFIALSVWLLWVGLRSR
jgi:disulfide bond formation protein DsbB